MERTDCVSDYSVVMTVIALRLPLHVIENWLPLHDEVLFIFTVHSKSYYVIKHIYNEDLGAVCSGWEKSGYVFTEMIWMSIDL